MARDLAAKIPDIDIPERLVAEVEPDHDAGVAAACEQILILRGGGAFDGVHLVPVSRYQQVAALLERELWTPAGPTEHGDVHVIARGLAAGGLAVPYSSGTS
ncbi:hypothetical protein CFP59_00653 [Streptomyces malaysiensis subsp. malaysiensis]|uniref:hypothetical protein n=1 Tax=Streptomyces TaxID=1883 RepID=UPI00081E59DB|nr:MULTISPECIES: hypothetical protein [unclassified Streptomyces]AUA08567.1 hypothetical protein CFP59_00653 [Streptomyces sp. M56]SCF60718.1 hypothetical protein GA0115260_1002415 [Streptomyces sp. MnatMP-M27]